MKTKIITINTNIGPLTYLSYYRGNKNNHDLKHKLNIKRELFKQHFTYYHPEMEFSNCEIIADNRK